jgi:hypothetical protein
MPSWSTQVQNIFHVCGYLQSYVLFPQILLKGKTPTCRKGTRYKARSYTLLFQKNK